MRSIGLLLITTAVLATAGSASAAMIGRGAFASLQQGPDARCLAMGSACVAIPGTGFEAAYWNPAGLGTKRVAGATGTDRFGLGIYSFYGGAVIPGGSVTAGASFFYQLVNNIIVDDPKSDRSQLINDRELVLIGSLAVPVQTGARRMKLGASVKIYQHTIGPLARGQGVGADIGFRYENDGGLVLAAAAADPLGTLIRWDTGQNDQIDRTVRLGLAYVGRPTLAGQITWNEQAGLRQLRYGLGAEAVFRSLVIRGGVNWRPGQGLNYALGAGLNFPAGNLDFAFLPARLGGSYILSAQVRF